MSMRRVLSIGGMPGTGKTTMVRKYMSKYQWESVEPVKLVNASYCKELDLYIIGKYEDPNAVFAGPDALSMAVQPAAIEFTSRYKSNILFEGDRLFTGTFMHHLFELPETEIAIFLLETSDAIREQRYKDRGSDQSDKFINGRKTKIKNVESTFGPTNRIKTFQHDTEDDMNIVVDSTERFFKGELEFKKVQTSLSDFF